MAGVDMNSLRDGRRVLILAHAFPPASLIGTMRTLRLVRRLDAEGWHTVVVMAMPETYPPGTPLDPALHARVPASTDILRAPVLRPIERLNDAVRGKNVPHAAASAGANTAQGNRPSLIRRFYGVVDELTSIPDREVGWIAPAVMKAMDAVRRHRPHAIYSTAPPWSAHLAGYAVARLTGLPWVADFRDPWARAPWREKQPERHRRAAARLESRVLSRADAVLFTTHGNRNEYAARYGEDLAGKFFVIPNGCDPDEFAGLNAARDRDADAPFVLLHAGSLYGQRTPVPLFKAVASAIAKGALQPERFRLRLIGQAALDHDLHEVVTRLGLADVVECRSRIPRSEILEAMAAASGLLVLQPGTTVSVPGKIFEYLALSKPLLALCEEGDTADLVRASGLGVAVTSKDEEAVEAGLLSVIQLAGQPNAPVNPELYDGNRRAFQMIEVIAGVGRARDSLQVTRHDDIDTPAAAKEATEWRP